MTHCAVGEPKVVNVILSEAKNLVLVRDAADMPRSFAALRMTICRSFAEKIDTPESVNPSMPPTWIPAFAGITVAGLLGKQVAGQSPYVPNDHSKISRPV